MPARARASTAASAAGTPPAASTANSATGDSSWISVATAGMLSASPSPQSSQLPSRYLSPRTSEEVMGEGERRRSTTAAGSGEEEQYDARYVMGVQLKLTTGELRRLVELRGKVAKANAARSAMRVPFGKSMAAWPPEL